MANGGEDGDSSGRDRANTSRDWASKMVDPTHQWTPRGSESEVTSGLDEQVLPRTGYLARLLMRLVPPVLTGSPRYPALMLLFMHTHVLLDEYWYMLGLNVSLSSTWAAYLC